MLVKMAQTALVTLVTLGIAARIPQIRGLVGLSAPVGG